MGFMSYETDTYEIYDEISRIPDPEHRDRVIMAGRCPVDVSENGTFAIKKRQFFNKSCKKAKEKEHFRFTNDDRRLIVNSLVISLPHDDICKLLLPDLTNQKTIDIIKNFHDLPTADDLPKTPYSYRADRIDPRLTPAENLAVSHQIQEFITQETHDHTVSELLTTTGTKKRQKTAKNPPSLYLFRPTFDARFRSIIDLAQQTADEDRRNTETAKNGCFLLKFWDTVTEYKDRICKIGQIKPRHIDKLLTQYRAENLPAFDAMDGIAFNENGAFIGWEILPGFELDDRACIAMLEKLAKLQSQADKIAEIRQKLDGAEIALADLIEPVISKYGPHAIRLANGYENTIDDIATETAQSARLAVRKTILLPGAKARFTNPITGQEIDLSQIPVQDRLAYSDPATWRRKLRKTGLFAQGLMTATLAMANNGKHYCSDHTTVHYVERKAKERQYLAKKCVTFEKRDGSQKSISLLEIADQKMSADIAEVYAINKAYEHEAHRLNLDAYFITLTLPGEYHPSPRRCNGGKNEDWTADTGPDRAGAELQKMWRNIMRDIKKIPEFLGAFGMKVLEPHKDGCPHLHAMLYLPATYQKNEDGLFSYEPTEEILNEIIARYVPGEHQREVRLIQKDETGETATMSPASYVMKYILKSMKDAGDRPDLLIANLKSKDPEIRQAAREELARFRHKAWLSTLGRRGFSFVGMRGVRTIWRRLWNATDDDMTGAGPALRSVKFLINDAQCALENDDQDTATESCASALRLLGAFPHFRPNYTVSLDYQERLTRHGRTQKKAENIVEIDSATGEVFTIALKSAEVKIEADTADLDWNNPKDQAEIRARQTMIASEQRRAEITETAVPWLMEEMDERARDFLTAQIALTFSNDAKEAGKAEMELHFLLQYLASGHGEKPGFLRNYTLFKRSWGTNSYLSKVEWGPDPDNPEPPF